jgi:predicted transcriptional regulator
MEVRLTPEQEAQLSAIANLAGVDPEEMIREAIDRIIQDDAHFREAVRKGIASADRGDLLDHDEVVERIERLFHQ